MIRSDKFLISQRPYAVDLGSLYIGDPRYASVRAVWFRRRRGSLVACIGELWDYQNAKPDTAEEFLRRHIDGRYGGTCKGRWDGNGYWGAQNLTVMSRYLMILRPMLENYPDIPPGFDGWWMFSDAQYRQEIEHTRQGKRSHEER